MRVMAGAFAHGSPRRDLWLSPRHAVAVEGALIPIVALLNGASVRQVRTSAVEYWHVELDAHDVIFAEGPPAETYLDNGNRAAFVNGGGLRRGASRLQAEALARHLPAAASKKGPRWRR